eukprot:scaffold4581_cov63-Phaeocystis_antarctica.AAC.3
MYSCAAHTPHILLTIPGFLVHPATAPAVAAVVARELVDQILVLRRRQGDQQRSNTKGHREDGEHIQAFCVCGRGRRWQGAESREEQPEDAGVSSDAKRHVAPRAVLLLGQRGRGARRDLKPVRVGVQAVPLRD